MCAMVCNRAERMSHSLILILHNQIQQYVYCTQRQSDGEQRHQGYHVCLQTGQLSSPRRPHKLLFVHTCTDRQSSVFHADYHLDQQPTLHHEETACNVVMLMAIVFQAAHSVGYNVDWVSRSVVCTGTSAASTGVQVLYIRVQCIQLKYYLFILFILIIYIYNNLYNLYKLLEIMQYSLDNVQVSP